MTDERGPAEQSLRALIQLIESGLWRVVGTGHAGVLLYVRLWDEGSTDSLSVKGSHDVLAERVNAYGQPVWRARGSVVAMTTKVSELPAPGTPDAPVRIPPPLDSGRQ